MSLYSKNDIHIWNVHPCTPPDIILVALYCKLLQLVWIELYSEHNIIVLFVHSEWLRWWSRCAAAPWTWVPLSRLPHHTGCYHWVKDCSCTPWEGNVFLHISVSCLSSYFWKLVAPWYLSQSLLTWSKSPVLITFKVSLDRPWKILVCQCPHCGQMGWKCPIGIMHINHMLHQRHRQHSGVFIPPCELLHICQHIRSDWYRL